MTAPATEPDLTTLRPGITEDVFRLLRARSNTPGPRRWDTPGQLAADLDPRTVQTPALDLIDAALVRLVNTPDGRLIVSVPPQEGKSQRVTRRFSTWCLRNNPDLRIAVVSHEHGMARRWGRQIRDDIRQHGEVLGLTVRADLSGQAEWQLAGYDGGVYAVGIQGGLTGRPVDLLIIDDPIKGTKQADSEQYREQVWQWWTDVGATRLAPGAPVVLIQTRWHSDDLAGRLLAAPDGDTWELLNIPAQADHRPEKGETDPLGREVGEFLLSARGRSVKQWEAIKVRSGSRTWNALYQGRPSAAAGDVLQREWWQTYDQPQWIERPDGVKLPQGFDDLLISWDMAFKDTDSSDYVVGQVWGRRGADAFLLDQVRARMDFPTTQHRFRELAARWPEALYKLVEDKANGTAVIASLNRVIGGIIPCEPVGSKVARARAVSPLIEAGNVWLPSPELCPWVGDFIEECAGFPNGAHDDQVDAMSQALNRLVLMPLLGEGDVYTDEDLDEDLADFQGPAYLR